MGNEVQGIKKNEVQPGFNTLENFEMSMRAAKLLASSTLVPQQFRQNVSNCVIALNMAHRMNADPFMVMQNLYIVKGNPGWSSKFLIATFNSCGRFSPIRFEFSGIEGKDDWGCIAYAIEKSTKEKIIGSKVTIKMAKGEGWYSKKDGKGNEISKWQTMPEQMMMYRAAAFLIRVSAPEISCGLPTQDELIDVTNSVKEEKTVEQEIEENANKEIIDIDEKEEAVEIIDEETGEIKETNEPSEAEKKAILEQERKEAKEQLEDDGAGF